ncbi:MAG: PHP domain-containing protein, partial [Chloroflexi bacterium]|nr:PHP domain-containing protein [Chloroflexota bacterium]
PGVGPKTVKLLWQRAGVEGVDDLRAALRAGTLRSVPGLSEKGIAALGAGVDALERRSSRLTLGAAERLVEALVAALADAPGARRVVPAGSYRRRRETIGDLDLLVETRDPAAVVRRLTSLPMVEAVLGSGPRQAAVRLAAGPRVDVMTMPPGEAGTYLVHFTGSKEHNVRLRAIARDRGWSLSELGFARLDESGTVVAGPDAELRTFASEAEVYRFLGLDEVPPELREDLGEVEAALEGRLPHLLTAADLRGDLHAHSDWSDGRDSIEAMAETARARGYAYLVLTDHSRSLAVANGLSPERVAAQRLVVAELNERFAAEEAAGTAPEATPAEGFRLLHGCELEIRADGSLDFDDDILAAFDVVVASLHVGRGQGRERLTARVLGALRNPHVDVLAHPAGRKLGERARADLDLAWDEVYAAAAETGTLLEINGSDHRLDLAPERARRAAAAGCTLTVDSDAHRVEELAGIGWGVAQARRAWLEPSAVATTWPRSRLLEWCAGKPARVA